LRRDRRERRSRQINNELFEWLFSLWYWRTTTTSGGLNPSLTRARSHSGKLVKIPFKTNKKPARAGPSVSSGPTNYSRLRCLVFKEHASPASPFPDLASEPPRGSWEWEATQNILALRHGWVKREFSDGGSAKNVPRSQTDNAGNSLFRAIPNRQRTRRPFRSGSRATRTASTSRSWAAERRSDTSQSGPPRSFARPA